MVGTNDGDMIPYLRIKRSHREWKGYPCIWANFMFDLETGEIQHFADYDDPDKIIDSEYYYYGFRMMKKGNQYRIDDFQPPSEATTLAKSNLYAVVGLYNDKHGFKE